jgi:hypothetical protein
MSWPTTAKAQGAVRHRHLRAQKQPDKRQNAAALESYRANCGGVRVLTSDIWPMPLEGASLPPAQTYSRTRLPAQPVCRSARRGRAGRPCAQNHSRIVRELAEANTNRYLDRHVASSQQLERMAILGRASDR